jgi:hypothetical protein
MNKKRAILLTVSGAIIVLIILLLFLTRDGKNLTAEQVTNVYAKHGIKLETPAQYVERNDLVENCTLLGDFIEDASTDLSTVHIVIECKDRTKGLYAFAKSVVEYGGVVNCLVFNKAKSQKNYDLQDDTYTNESGESEISEGVAGNVHCRYKEYTTSLNTSKDRKENTSPSRIKEFQNANAELKELSGRGPLAGGKLKFWRQD